MSINKESIIKLNSSIIKRFEKNINGGTIFLFNSDTDEIWTGNLASYQIIKFIDEKIRVEELCNLFLSYFSNYDREQVLNSVYCVLKELIDKNFLEVIEEV